jgi:hypothetical protein
MASNINHSAHRARWADAASADRGINANQSFVDAREAELVVFRRWIDFHRSDSRRAGGLTRASFGEAPFFGGRLCIAVSSLELFDDLAHAAEALGAIDESDDLRILVEQLALRLLGVVGYARRLL